MFPIATYGIGVIFVKMVIKSDNVKINYMLYKGQENNLKHLIICQIYSQTQTHILFHAPNIFIAEHASHTITAI